MQAVEPGTSLRFDRIDRDGSAVDPPVVIEANTDPESPIFGKPYVGVASGDGYATCRALGAGGSAVMPLLDLPDLMWESVKGVVKVLNPVNSRGN